MTDAPEPLDEEAPGWALPLGASPCPESVTEAAEPRPITGWPAREEHREQLVAEFEYAAGMIARWQAAQSRMLAEALDLALIDGTSGRTPELEVRSMAAELACLIGLSDRTVAAQMADAVVLRDRFPAVCDSFREGRLPRSHVAVIVDEGVRLDDASRAEYQRIMIDLASEGLSSGRLRAAAKPIAEQLMPTTLVERYREASAHRRVEVRQGDDGMAELVAVLPAALAFAIHDRLGQFARLVQDAERVRVTSEAASAESGEESAEDSADQRTIDQLRADILCDIALTGHASIAESDRDGGAALDAVRGIVQITIPADVLIDRPSTVPATLTGQGPIDPESARCLAGNAGMWARVLTDPFTGDVLRVDRRFPSEAQSRLLRARDEHCRFPGCRMPVWRCDRDHTIDHQRGGATSVCNLAHLCRRHHVMKHNTAWSVEQLERGVLVWTSPTGRIYTDRPPPAVRFVRAA